MPIRSYDEGSRYIPTVTKGSSVSIVKVFSQSHPMVITTYRDGLDIRLRREGIISPIEYTYFPQKDGSYADYKRLEGKMFVSPLGREFQFLNQVAEGQIPAVYRRAVSRLANPGKTYIIVDDEMITGRTLDEAVDMLVAKGALRENLWYHGMIRGAAKKLHPGLVLDKVEEIRDMIVA
jgi:hypothetical protein